ncbi:hypothetical protein AMTR_s00022p00219350 [Amborella trichopoda]|uniref:F-box associated domain-containing protein n=1 Tax=Amborella trichopoda TaxID=13333 RepID=W1PUF2_AMBTC|nr:hypothetical protein AMTR_s00022p00219350 [Amborella trichopoda]
MASCVSWVPNTYASPAAKKRNFSLSLIRPPANSTVSPAILYIKLEPLGMAFGFYFDPEDHTFKILAMLANVEQNMIFDSCTGGWRTAAPAGSGRIFVACIVAIKRTFYCVGKSELLALNMESEQWEIIPIPPMNPYPCILDWDGRVCVADVTRVYEMNLWAMGQEKEWVKIITINFPELGMKVTYPRLDVTPVLLVGETLFCE